jgi:actin-like ATPase involved in cell morphogenesis
MSYYLGIDLGTTYTAAAIERGGTVEALTLGNRTASVPSVVFLRDDGEFLIGEAATRRAATDPGRVAREFKRRVGDPTPIILGGTPYAAEMLMARMLRWGLDRVVEQEGGQPTGIALTHPANWGPYKLDLLKQAVRQVDVDAELMLAEPVAAATFYASQRRLDPGAVVAVYDLGGGTFDAAMVRRTPTGFESIGTPEGIERLGGIDFDEAVVAHVRDAAGDALDQLDPEDASALAAMARLRQECIDAKEALSSDTDVSIPVLLPNLQTEVRLTRSEFENMVRPAISETITALRRSIRSAKVADDDISAVLLVGGSSRIPLVAQMVATELGRPIAIDAHPKDAISFGAAIAVAARKGQATPESVKTVLPSDNRPPPPTVALTNRPRPAPPVPRPAPPGAPGSDRRPAPPVAPAAAAGAAGAAAMGLGGAPGAAARPAPPTDRPAPPPQVPGERPSPGGAVPGRPGSPPGGPGVAMPGAPAPGGPGGAGGPGVPGPGPAVGSPVGSPGPGSGDRFVPPGQVPSGERPAAGFGQQPGRPGAPGAGGAYAAGAGAGGYGGSPQASPAGAPYAPQPAYGPPSGGGPSGGFPAAGGGRGGPDNKVLWIVVGVVGVIALVLIIVALAGGGDDQASDGGGSSTTGSDTTGGTATTVDPSGGYNDAVEQGFIQGCTGELTGTTTGTSESQCQCAWDEIEATIPYSDFVEMSAQMSGDSTDIPDELMTIMVGCLSQES